VAREGEDAADTAATTEERAAAPVVTGVSPVVAREGQDAADTAATTEERAAAPVVTGVSPVVSLEGQDAAGDGGYYRRGESGSTRKPLYLSA